MSHTSPGDFLVLVADDDQCLEPNEDMLERTYAKVNHLIPRRVVNIGFEGADHHDLK